MGCVLNGGQWKQDTASCRRFLTLTTGSYNVSMAQAGACLAEFGDEYIMCDTVQALSLASLHSAAGVAKVAAAGMQAWVREWTGQSGQLQTVSKITSLLPRCDMKLQHHAVSVGSAASTDHATCVVASA